MLIKIRGLDPINRRDIIELSNVNVEFDKQDKKFKVKDPRYEAVEFTMSYFKKYTSRRGDQVMLDLVAARQAVPRLTSVSPTRESAGAPTPLEPMRFPAREPVRAAPILDTNTIEVTIHGWHPINRIDLLEIPNVAMQLKSNGYYKITDKRFNGEVFSPELLRRDNRQQLVLDLAGANLETPRFNSSQGNNPQVYDAFIPERHRFNQDSAGDDIVRVEDTDHLMQGNKGIIEPTANRLGAEVKAKPIDAASSPDSRRSSVRSDASIPSSVPLRRESVDCNPSISSPPRAQNPAPATPSSAQRYDWKPDSRTPTTPSSSQRHDWRNPKISNNQNFHQPADKPVPRNFNSPRSNARENQPVSSSRIQDFQKSSGPKAGANQQKNSPASALSSTKPITHKYLPAGGGRNAAGVQEKRTYHPDDKVKYKPGNSGPDVDKTNSSNKRPK